MNTLDGFGARLSVLMANVARTQTELATDLDVSQGFVSDLIRGNKKPGAEFLHALREQYGVSVDWLLTGDGTMYGGNPVELELFKLIVALTGLVRAALIEGSPRAKALVKRLQGQSEKGGGLDEELLQALQRYADHGEEALLAVVLYNSHLWTARPDERLRNALSGALAYFQAKRPLDILGALKGGGSGSPSDAKPSRINPTAAQVNIGRHVRAAGRDYHESGKTPKKK